MGEGGNAASGGSYVGDGGGNGGLELELSMLMPPPLRTLRGLEHTIAEAVAQGVQGKVLKAAHRKRDKVLADMRRSVDVRGERLEDRLNDARCLPLRAEPAPPSAGGRRPRRAARLVNGLRRAHPASAHLVRAARAAGVSLSANAAAAPSTGVSASASLSAAAIAPRSSASAGSATRG